MLNRTRILTLSVLITGTSNALAQAPTKAEVDKAVLEACQLLLTNQENYSPDRPLGRLPDDKLSAWQEKETKRLDELRLDAAGDAKEWPYEGVYRVRGGVIPPGYRVGGSAIVCLALLEADGFDNERKLAMKRSTEFMLDSIHNNAGMQAKKQTNYDVRGWGWAYGLRFFLRALEKDLFDDDKKLTARVKATVPHLIACLKEGQVPSGGWNYAGPRAFSPFMTGSTLVALFHAKAAGYDVDEEMVENALDALETGRGESMAYSYSGKLRNQNEPMQGASARSAVAELVLYRAGRSSIENLTKAVRAFFVIENWKELRKRKSQQGTHKRPYGIAPYYFFYGHTYAALAAEHLPADKREQYPEQMRALLWRTIDENGGWNDRIFPRTESYSTAMAVLALIAADLPRVHEWSKKE